MTTEEALNFLRSHQPLPPTAQISEGLLKLFDEVRKHFAAHPDNRSVPLLLNAFGAGDGHGVYQLVEDTILAHPEEIVIPALIDGLRSPHRSVREWCAEIAANYPRSELTAPLVEVLRRGSVDERIAAVAALAMIESPEATTELRKALEHETEEGVKKAIRRAMDS